MSEVLELIEQLKHRLPEIELRLSKIGAIASNLLPRGLFRMNNFDKKDATFFIKDIQRDLQLLANCSEAYSAQFLVQQIQQKMNVLLSLCRRNKPKGTQQFEMNQIMTRQQWLNSINKEVGRLETQEKALRCTLDRHWDNPSLSQAIQKELEEVKQQLNTVKLLL